MVETYTVIGTCACNTFEKFMNPNCLFYHAQAKELDAQYSANVCTVMAPGIDYIWRHGAADIQMPSLVGSKRKR